VARSMGKTKNVDDFLRGAHSMDSAVIWPSYLTLLASDGRPDVHSRSSEYPLDLNLGLYNYLLSATEDSRR
jgi:hypothetical protein